jgi:hypothetical protein
MTRIMAFDFIRVNPGKSVAKGSSAFPRPIRRVHRDPVRRHRPDVHRVRRVHDPDRHHRDVHRVRHGLHHADDLHEDDHRQPQPAPARLRD